MSSRDILAVWFAGDKCKLDDALTDYKIAAALTSPSPVYVYSNTITSWSSLATALNSHKAKITDLHVMCPKMTNLNATPSGGNGYFEEHSKIESANFPYITKIEGENCGKFMFYNSTIESIDFPSLGEIIGQSACNAMFYNCSSLQDVNLSSLFFI